MSLDQILSQMKYRRRRDLCPRESIRFEGRDALDRRYTSVRPDKLRSKHGNPAAPKRTHTQPQIVPGSRPRDKTRLPDARNRDKRLPVRSPYRMPTSVDWCFPAGIPRCYESSYKSPSLGKNRVAVSRTHVAQVAPAYPTRNIGSDKGMESP